MTVLSTRPRSVHRNLQLTQCVLENNLKIRENLEGVTILRGYCKTMPAVPNSVKDEICYR